MCTLALAGVLLSCGRPDPREGDDPREALKLFLAALEVKQLETAWTFLLPEDRAVLEQRQAAFEALSGGEVERAPWSFLSPGHVVSSAREYASMRVDPNASEGDRTVVVVELHDGRSFDVSMVRKDGLWYVDLPLESLSAAPVGSVPSPPPANDPPMNRITPE